MTESAATFTPWLFRADSKIAKTPAIADDVVYVTTSAGVVHALHGASSERLWEHRLTAPAASAPIVTGGVVLLNLNKGGGRYGGGTAMVALDTSTGEQRWDNPHQGFSGAAAADEHGRVFVDSGRGKLLAVDAATGEIAWRSDLEEFERNRGPYSHIFSVNTPVWSTGDCVFVHISTSVCYCLDARDGTVFWRTSYGSYYNSYSTPAVHDGVVYLGTGDGGLVCLAADTGHIRHGGRPPWEALHSAVGWQDPTVRSPVIDSGLVVVGDSMFFGARNGFLCRYHPVDGLRLVDNLAASWGAPEPVPAGKRVLALWPRGQLGAFDARDGMLTWRSRIRRRSSGVAANEQMFCFGRSRTLLANEAATGRGPRGTGPWRRTPRAARRT